MPRKRSRTLTDAEHRIMEVLWNKGSATVAEVVEALSGKDGTAYTTILTMMRILHEKGYLSCSKEGRAHTYTPRVDRTTAARKAVRQVLAKFFAGSPGELVLSFLRDEEISPEELDELKKRFLERTSQRNECRTRHVVQSAPRRAVQRQDIGAANASHRKATPANRARPGEDRAGQTRIRTQTLRRSQAKALDSFLAARAPSYARSSLSSYGRVKLCATSERLFERGRRDAPCARLRSKRFRLPTLRQTI